MSEYEFCKEISCDECRFSDFGKSSNCCFDRMSYEKGIVDEREKIFEWLKTKDLRFGDKESLQELYEYEQQLKEQKNEL